MPAGRDAPRARNGDTGADGTSSGKLQTLLETGASTTDPGRRQKLLYDARGRLTEVQRCTDYATSCGVYQS